MQALRFDNRFTRELPGDPQTDSSPRQVEGALWSPVRPQPVVAPRLLAVAHEVAALLGLEVEDLDAGVLAGNTLLDGMQPYAGNYGGHQFGVWAGQLGDGRAIGLGEVIAADGGRWELQLKGAGHTPYSRGADGRAVLRSSLREFLCSEAMHHLGIATTRALSLVGTGETVVRDMFYDGHPRAEPGAVVCRVAPSFIRFGHFELPTARGDVGLLRRLVDFTIDRDFPHLADRGEARYGDWFAEMCALTARTVAQWMRVGFVHGVMNTDNMSVLGLTLDYGPYGWLEEYDPDWTPNTTDAGRRRYRFGQQPQVAYWNLGRLAVALAPLFDGDAGALQDGLQRYVEVFNRADRGHTAAKLGLADLYDEDAALGTELQRLLCASHQDMTLAFRTLSDSEPDVLDAAAFAASSYQAARFAAEAPAWNAWLEGWRRRLAADPLPAAERRARMDAANPRFVLRNWLAQQAIERAEAGDTGGIETLLEVVRRPYAAQPGREAFATMRPAWAVQRAGCSMLSCSS